MIAEPRLTESFIGANGHTRTWWLVSKGLPLFTTSVAAPAPAKRPRRWAESSAQHRTALPRAPPPPTPANAPRPQGARVTALEAEASEAELRATLIEYNLGEVDAAINAVNAAIASGAGVWREPAEQKARGGARLSSSKAHAARGCCARSSQHTQRARARAWHDNCALPLLPPSGMDWRELDTMIREERRAGNPVACLIHSLQLDQNRATLLLANNLDEEVAGGGLVAGGSLGDSRHVARPCCTGGAQGAPGEAPVWRRARAANRRDLLAQCLDQQVLPGRGTAGQNNSTRQDDSEEAQTRPATKVPVDLALSAYANARQVRPAFARELACSCLLAHSCVLGARRRHGCVGRRVPSPQASLK